MTTPRTCGPAVRAPANRVPLLVCAILTIALVAGCSPVRAGSTQPDASARPPAAVLSTTQVASEAAIPAPTDLSTAKRLLRERRVGFDTGRMLGPAGTPGGVSGESSDTPVSAAGKFGVPLRFPDPSLVATPTYIWTSKVKSGEYHAGALYNGDLHWEATPARHKIHDFPGQVDKSPSVSNGLVPYALGAGKAYPTLVSVRGNVGVAQTRYSRTTPKTFTAAPSRVEWVEGGIDYQVYSFHLDPDQLLAIAGTTVLVKQ